MSDVPVSDVPAATDAAPADAAARSGQPAPPLSAGRVALWLMGLAVVVVLGLAIPLKILPLKEKKAEAEAIPPRIHVERPPQFGVASWYGDREAGRLTASGDVFNPRGLTAAHRTLPLGTEVRVTRLGTKESVTVLVNDRGPYIRGRVIDLSVAAAEKLHMQPQGLARVKIEIVSEPTNVTNVANKAITRLPKAQQKGLVAMPPDAGAAKPKAPESIAEGVPGSP